MLDALKETGWQLTHILNTHHHSDHTGGNLELKAATGCTIVGPRADRDRIPGIDIEVGDGDTYEFGERAAQGVRRARPYARPYRLLVRRFARAVLRRHAVHHGLRPPVRRHAGADVELARQAQGAAARHADFLRARIHPEQRALRADASSPATTICARGRSASTRCARATSPTVPGTLAEELLTNPFLRADLPRAASRPAGAVGDPVATLAEIRHRKDMF